MTSTIAQLRAVTTDSRDVLCIAGAGSGKTRVLVERIAHLLTVRGAQSGEIVCLTFTRRAAGEMKARLLNRLRESDLAEDAERIVAAVTMGTFHSVALQIVQDHKDRLGYEELTVVNEDDAELLLATACEDLGYVRNGKWREQLSMAKVRAALEGYYTSGVEPTLECERLIVREYGARLYAMQCLDFGRILIECRRMFSEFPEVLESYRSRIRHVLVDEMQDSDTIQYDLHDWFAPPASFFGVGDTRQSIYGFRGARPNLMRELHPDAEVIDLADNFRSGAAIVDAANALIAHNPEPVAPMRCATGRAGTARTMTGRSADIAAAVQALARDGYAWSDIAVLARRHSTLERLADALAEAGIPHHRVGSGTDICEGKAFLELHAALRLCVNPRDRMAALRLSRSPDPRRDGFIAVIRSAILGGDADVIATDVGPAACDIAGGVTPEVAWWQEHCPDTHIEDALRWYAIMDSQDDLPRGNVVTLATIHAAKGLEWPAVIVANCMEGELPGTRASREPGGIEEERRCAYVAATRARESLTLHYRRIEDQAADRKPQAPSRFIQEAGLNLWVRNP